MSAGIAAAAGGVLPYADAADALAAAYRAAEAELREDLEDLVRLTLQDDRVGRRERIRQRRALLTRVALLRADLEQQALLFTDDTLATIYADGMGRADRVLAASGVAAPGIGAGTFATVHVQALSVLAADTFDDLAQATQVLDASVRRVIREAAKIETTAGAAAGRSVQRDTSALVRRLARDGVTGFVDAAGRGWRMSSYAEMVVRTKSAQAYNTGTVLRTQEAGVEVVVIRDGDRSGHEPCASKNGQTATTAWALANAVEHPNCVRRFLPRPLHTGPVVWG